MTDSAEIVALRKRLLRNANVLLDMAIAATDPLEQKRLEGKAEGLRLAEAYAEEAER